MEKIFEIYIKTTPERLWQAITDTEMRRKWNFGAIVTSDWTPGSRYQGIGGESLIVEGENLEVDPPRRLVQSYRALWSEAVKSEGTSRVTWEIEPVGDSCLLKVTHDQLREGANNQLYGGWPMVLSGIKTLLETGEMLTTPGSLRWLRGRPDANARRALTRAWRRNPRRNILAPAHPPEVAMVRKLWRLAVAIVAVVFVLLGIGLWFASDQLLFPAWRGATRDFSDCKAELAKYWGRDCGDLRASHEFKFSEIRLPSVNGYSLPGWLIGSAENGKGLAKGAIMLIPAGGSDRREVTKYIPFLLGRESRHPDAGPGMPGRGAMSCCGDELRTKGIARCSLSLSLSRRQI